MKKLFFFAAIVAAAAFGVMNATENNNMTDLQMENVELLAEGEDDCNILVSEREPGNPQNGVKWACQGSGSLECC